MNSLDTWFRGGGAPVLLLWERLSASTSNHQTLHAEILLPLKTAKNRAWLIRMDGTFSAMAVTNGTSTSGLDDADQSFEN
jgi:hypothetical protein